MKITHGQFVIKIFEENNMKIKEGCTMKIKGMEAKHIGLVGWVAPWLSKNECDIFYDLWGTPDGKRYVERHVQANIVEYNWQKHGYIWYNWIINKHYQDYVKVWADYWTDDE